MYHYRAVVERVRDGDTVRFRADLGFDTWHVGPFRLLGIAARELDEPGGPEARDHLEDLLPVGAIVDLFSRKPDKWGGRYLARITLADGRDLAEVLIAEGWAARWNGRGVAPMPAWPRPEVEVPA